jgi:hypothetical protein
MGRKLEKKFLLRKKLFFRFIVRIFILERNNFGPFSPTNKHHSFHTHNSNIMLMKKILFYAVCCCFLFYLLAG